MIDMHCHSTCSDGKFTPIELLKMAEQNKLNYFSITDHDSVASCEQILNVDIKKYFSGKFILGAELRFLYKGEQLELLCYGYDYNKIKDSFWVSKECYHCLKKGLLESLLVKAKDLGFKYNLIEYNPNTKPESVFYNELLKYEQNLPILQSYKIKHSGDFYRKLIASVDSPIFFDSTSYSPTFDEIVELIHKSGGLAILAHPFGVYNLKNPKQTLNELIALGKLDGIECMHANMTQEDTEYLLDICKKHDLVSTGGSDFHGYPGQVFAKANFGKNDITDHLIDKFLQKLEKTK
ncbi:MAG: PHP domain-containing protein [Clostridia bacterium]|nr:PHP domain-containing protein [Clostridia bacterium]